MSAFNSSIPSLDERKECFAKKSLEWFSTFGVVHCKLPCVRLCNLANPGGDGGDDVYVCGCLVNAGKGLGGSQQLWD